jgi:hypothetical protein
VTELRVNPLNPAILQAYKGRLIREHELSKNYIGMEIEFPTMYHAAQWAEICGVPNRVRLVAGHLHYHRFDTPVLVQYTRPKDFDKDVD